MSSTEPPLTKVVVQSDARSLDGKADRVANITAVTNVREVLQEEEDPRAGGRLESEVGEVGDVGVARVAKGEKESKIERDKMGGNMGKAAAAAAAAACRLSKRSTSSSNDLLYERDRFRARFQTLNAESSENLDDGTNGDALEDEECEVCVGIGFKTARLKMIRHRRRGELSSRDQYSLDEELSPLDARSWFFHSCGETMETFTEFYEKMVIKSIDMVQVQSVFHWYFSKELPPTAEMFPWLHGLNRDNFAQRHFFLSQLQESGFNTVDEGRPKCARFLMCAVSDTGDMESKPMLKNTVTMKEILQPIDISNKEVFKLITGVLGTILTLEELDLINRLTETLHQDAMKTGFLPLFLELDPDRGVSLRNFHIQVAKVATCSDFLVYCFSPHHLKGSGCKCASLARLLWLAQVYAAHEEKATTSRYNVFVIDDSRFIHDVLNDDIEENCFKSLFSAHVSGVNSHFVKSKKTQLDISAHGSNLDTLTAWETDFPTKEKIETTKMSAATRIHQNVWAGNFWDYQVTVQYLQSTETEVERIKWNQKDLYCDPNNSILTLQESDNSSSSIFDQLSPPKANWRLFIHCHNDASFPNLSKLSALLYKYTISPHDMQDSEAHSLEFPSSGSIGIGDCRKEAIISIVNTCKLLYLYSSSNSKSQHVLSSLIYCSDGYTELSLLVLCYLMYAHSITLDKAILMLHLECGRPFYIFNSDVKILTKLQVILNKLSPICSKQEMNWSELDLISNKELNELLLYHCPKSIIHHQVGVPVGNFKSSFSYDTDSDTDTSSAYSGESYLDHLVSANWVHEVEGSIPSRILPYLYLGSLQHANSLALLLQLGIKQVISVGEQLEWLNGYKFMSNYNVDIEEVDGGNIEVYTIAPCHPSIKPCCVNTVIKVNNLQDDGIDELATSLPTILNYIDTEYNRSNGATKILVHCRVGVSRSATVAIAEVMRRMNTTLPKAYLYVRVRRLNIIIQPNLRFMYELFKWEEQEKKRIKNSLAPDQSPTREVDWFVMCREIMKLNIPYLMSS